MAVLITFDEEHELLELEEHIRTTNEMAALHNKVMPNPRIVHLHTPHHPCHHGPKQHNLPSDRLARVQWVQVEVLMAESHPISPVAGRRWDWLDCTHNMIRVLTSQPTAMANAVVCRALRTLFAAFCDAPLAATMALAVVCRALRTLFAAFCHAPLATTMCYAVVCLAFSTLFAALCHAPLAAAMAFAVV